MAAEVAAGEPARPPGAGGATRVAAGILLSRLAGFFREAALAYYFGVGPHADVFRTALRGPNLLQNLLGEQTLSASFIPIYSRMLEEGRAEEGGRFAGALFGLLLAVAAGVVLAGIALAPAIAALLAPGYLGDAAAVAAGEARVDRYPLAVTAIRILFPMTGLLVLSAWAVAILNSHRRFFLSYAAPVLWNAGIIALLWGAGTLLVAGPVGGTGERVSGTTLNRLVVAACIGALLGGLLQFGAQLPLVIRLLRGFRLSFSTRVPGIRDALRAFAPLAAGRGAVQLSGYLDLVLASLLAAGAVGSLGYAQVLYLLPVSLFGMSVAAAELPELSRQARPEGAGALASRGEGALRQAAFLTAPTAVGYLAFGHLLVAAIFRRGTFGRADTWLVYLVLAGYTCGLLASVSSRILSNVFYSLRETRVPARVAVERVLWSAALAIPLMLWLDRYPVAAAFGGGAREGALRLGAVGLSLAAGLASWWELGRLRGRLRRRLPHLRLPLRPAAGMLGLALAAVVPGAAAWWLTASLPPLLTAALVLGCYAAAYFLLSHWVGLREARAWLPGRGGGAGA